MSNQSFKNRIKGYKVEKNTEAWDQMSSLLDNVSEAPVVEEDKKKRKGWLWIVLGMMLFLVIAYFAFDFSSINENVLNTNKKITNQPQRPINTLSDQGSDQGYDTNSVRTETTDAVHANQEMSTHETTIRDQSNADNRISNKRVSQKEGSNFNGSNQSQKNNTVNENRVGSNSNSSYDDLNESQSGISSNPDVIGADILNLNDAESNKYSQSSDATGQNNVGLSDSNSATSDKPTSDEELSTVEPLDAITSLDLNGLLSDIATLPLQIEPAKIKQHRFSIFGSGGYAKFNNNGGFHFDAGVVYDLSKILSVESSLGYSRGSDRTMNIGPDFEFERQIELSLLFHLNLLKTERQKAAILLGPTYVFYKGQRLINQGGPSEMFDFRSNNGFGATLGLLLTQDIGHRWTIGGRIGVIPYDDSVTFYNLLLQYKL